MNTWIRHTFPFVPKDIILFWQTLHKNPRHGFILGAGVPLHNNHHVYLSMEEPIHVLSITTLEKWKSNGSRDPVPYIIGMLGFESSRGFDKGFKKLPRKKDPLHFPSSVFGVYGSVIEIDLLHNKLTLWVNTRHKNSFSNAIKKIKNAFKCQSQCQDLKKIRVHSSRKNFEFPSNHLFSKMVQKAKGHIREGDIYQANLSIRFKGSLKKSPVDLYRLLCKKNPSPYSCLIKQPNQWIVSCSPELLMKVENSQITTRPIAGTRPRGKTKQGDNMKKGQLLLSPKERAEHIMLVDLERNDLGRVCEPGSVRVSDPYSIERYSHVMHIVSSVEGKLKVNTNAISALKSLFPGGTITGCPKIRSTELINEIEPLSRGPFYGSAGYIRANGDAVFNILIRTALVKKGRVYIQAGAGIVADSHPSREYKEVLNKAQVLLESVNDINGLN